MQRRKKKGSIAVTMMAALLVLVAVVAFLVQCSKRNNPQDTPKPAMPELLFDCDHFVFGGGSAPAEQVPDPDPDPDPKPDPDPDPEPGNADFTLNAKELLYIPGGETSATLTSTKAGVEWTAEWEDPASEWAGGKRTEDYVRLTPSGGTVEIEFLAPFGERVKIVCSDGSGSRECLCGCLKTIKTYKGYFRMWDSVAHNTYFGYDTFTFGGTYLDSMENMSSVNTIVEEESYFPYTEEQTLEWDIETSEYRLTQEFIESFRAYAETSGSINDNIRAKLNALSAEKAYPVLNNDNDGHLVFCGAGMGSAFCFPPLCEGLEADDKSAMGQLLSDWCDVGSNAETEIIEAVYRFTGSRSDCAMILRQRAYFGVERPVIHKITYEVTGGEAYGLFVTGLPGQGLAGKEITFTAQATGIYYSVSVTVTGSAIEDQPLSPAGGVYSHDYSFTMPACDVVIKFGLRSGG